ncbi:MAG: orotidine-5'-phosphate decarboxylase [Dehalococcoidia bacterium]|nr:orotidine-5'-phosphate decarboxylase [Dehalococcoidia bacterium]
MPAGESPSPFRAAVEARMQSHETRLCVGIDPIWEELPPPVLGDPALTGDRIRRALTQYSCGLVEAVERHAACVKFQVAFFERFGSTGYRALEDSVRFAKKRGLPVIADAKRADIGSTAKAYAQFLLTDQGLDADAVTVMPYMGSESIEPFLGLKGKMVFVVARSSNPSGAELQLLELADGRRVYEAVVDLVTRLEAWGKGTELGLVVGATDPVVLREARVRAPRAMILVPGVGAQGGLPADVIAAAGSEPGSIVVNASRSIYYAAEGPGFAEAAAGAARQLRDELAAAASPAA